jgi:hypothetical protein
MTGVELSAVAEPSGSAASIWQKPVRTLLGHLADLLLPPVCISCRTRIGSHGLLCGGCFAKIDFIAPPICARLGVPLPYDAGEPSLSGAAIAKPPVYDRARAAARYSATMRDLIESFKYRDRHEGLPLVGLWLKKAGAELLADAEHIVPVPLYPSRLWWRRFNQSAMPEASGGSPAFRSTASCSPACGGRKARSGFRPTKGAGMWQEPSRCRRRARTASRARGLWSWMT